VCKVFPADKDLFIIQSGIYYMMKRFTTYGLYLLIFQKDLEETYSESYPLEKKLMFCGKKKKLHKIMDLVVQILNW
jgi:hypothetical protein